MRLAECDHYLRRFKAAREALEPCTRSAGRRAEALFFYLTATRELGARRRLRPAHARARVRLSEDSWSEEALNNLATHFIVADDDDAADATFREVLDRFPRAATRSARRGRWAGTRTVPATTTRPSSIFEQAASRFPRSDYRPSWLYWAAAVARQARSTDTANARLALVVADYQNSYYGRMATKLLAERSASGTQVGRDDRRRGSSRRQLADPGLPPTHDLIRQLIAARAVRRCDERAAVRAAHVGRFAGDSGDDRADLFARRASCGRASTR